MTNLGSEHMKYFATNKNTGFTLIEMLIVVALVAILAAIAMPAYNGYINRSKIKTAQADLTALSLNLENIYQRKLTYPSASLGANKAALTANNQLKGWSPASSDFEFAHATREVSGEVVGYTLSATGSSGTAGCEITLNDQGTKELKDVSGSTCNYKGGSGWL